MPTESPDPLDVIAARYVKAAQQLVHDVAQVGIDAYNKINGDPQATPTGPLEYTPADAIQSATQLASAVAAGAGALARVALQVRWDRRVLLVADNVASIVGTGVDDMIGVVGDLARKSNGASVPERQQALVDAAIQLTNVSALRGTEIVETVIAGPGPYLDPVLRRSFSIAPSAFDATLAVTTMTRLGDDVDVHALFTFDPASGTLPAGQDQFTLVINTAGLPSGVYAGTVTATDTAADPGDEPAVRSVDVAMTLPETTDPPEP